MKTHLVNLVLLAGLGLSLGACGASRPSYDYAVEQSNPGAYRVGPGDVLQVSVWKNDQLSQKVGVRPDGAITLPLLGDVPVAGKTGGEIASEISQRATKYFNEPPSVTVQIAEIKSYRVYVLGEVQRPGEYAPGAQITILQALSLGGGFTRFADPDQIVVVRADEKGSRRIPFVFSQVIDRGDMRENILLRSGDIVVVP